MQLKVIKYRLYPEDNPIGYAVGFNVKLIIKGGPNDNRRIHKSNR